MPLTRRWLLTAAAGGVGHVAVQLAADAGAHVIGTASGYNEAFLRNLGVADTTARLDAEGIEHHVSGETLEAMRRFNAARQD